MSTTRQSQQLVGAWTQQRVWSLTANLLKRSLDQARRAALLLAIAAAALAVAADQIGLSSASGRAVSAAAAIAAGLATFCQRRVSTDQIRTWTRARSASEGLKTEIYSYLGGGTAYVSAEDRDRRLGDQTRSITEAVADLQRRTLGIKPDAKPLPAVHDVGSYITLRVNDQIDKYYTPKAAIYETRVRQLRFFGDLLGVTAVIFAAVAAAFEIGGLAAWVPVVTTIGTAVTAHITAARYDHMVIEYLRTAQRLAHLRDTYLDKPGGKAAEFIDACEDAISVENQGWMARWNADEKTSSADSSGSTS